MFSAVYFSMVYQVWIEQTKTVCYVYCSVLHVPFSLSIEIHACLWCFVLAVCSYSVVFHRSVEVSHTVRVRTLRPTLSRYTRPWDTCFKVRALKSHTNTTEIHVLYARALKSPYTIRPQFM